MTILAGLHEERRYRSLYCEQCGDVYAVMASSPEARVRSPRFALHRLRHARVPVVLAPRREALLGLPGNRRRSMDPDCVEYRGTMENLRSNLPISVAANVADQPATLRRPIVAAAVWPRPSLCCSSP
jgi:hypothetical protein